MAEQYFKEITAKRVEEDETVQDGAAHREGFYKLESSPNMFPLCFVLFILLESSTRQGAFALLDLHFRGYSLGAHRAGCLIIYSHIFDMMEMLTGRVSDKLRTHRAVCFLEVPRGSLCGQWEV